jgi:hypothetical protein
MNQYLKRELQYEYQLSSVRNMRICLFLLLWFLIAGPLPIQADKSIMHRTPPVVKKEDTIKAPWLTGPLLAPAAATIPPHHYYIEPYVYAVANTGEYNQNWEVDKTDTFWNNYFQPSIQIGITTWLDFAFNPTLYYNYKDGAAKWALGDMPILFDFQLYQKQTTTPTAWVNAIKLYLKENIPFGKYRNLNPKKRGTDIGGSGCWASAIGIVWGQLTHIWKQHFFDTRISLQYTYSPPVIVKSFNFYGGGFGTKGKVYPGQNFEVDIGMEFTLDLNWVLAMDIVGNWSGKTRFSGKRGVDAAGIAASIGNEYSVQYSIAPAIEYNWSADIGIIFGPWFTLGGRNALQFESGVFAFSYYH